MRPGEVQASVSIPYALDRKYMKAALSPGWQYLFPSGRYAYIESHGEKRRHHRHPASVQRAVRSAVRSPLDAG